MQYLLGKIDPLFMEFLNLPAFPSADHKLTLWMVIHLLFVSAILVYSCSLIRSFLLRKVLPRFPQVEVGVGHSMVSIVSWLIMCIGFLVVLDTAGIDITIVTVIAGAVGLGASMSLQNIATNIMSGILILLERPIKVGDHIEIGSITGRVVDISLRSTAIVTNDNIAVIVPNAEFVSSKVINWSYKDKSVRFKVPMSILKQGNFYAVQELLINVALTHPGVLAEPAPEVRMTGFSAETVDLALLIWTHDYAGDPEKLQSDLNYAICQALQRENMQMPMAEGSITKSAELLFKP